MAKFGILFKKTSTSKANFLDTALEYLDENSEYSQEVKKKQRTISNQHNGFEKGVNYLQKEMEGSIQLGGYFNSLFYKETGQIPEKVDNESRKKGAYHIFQKHLKEKGSFKGYTAHKMVFSMSKELEKKCLEAGEQPEDILVSSMKNSIRNFQKKFHKGDQIGYAWGIHHDTDNIHIHVLMSNKTKDNKVVGMSQGLSGKCDYKRKTQRKEHIVDIKKWVENHEQNVWKYLDRKIEGLENSVVISRASSKNKDIVYAPSQKYIKEASLKLEDIASNYWDTVRKIEGNITAIKEVNTEISDSYTELKALNEKSKMVWESIRKDRESRWENRKKWYKNKTISIALKAHDSMKKVQENKTINSLVNQVSELKSNLKSDIDLLKTCKENYQTKVTTLKKEKSSIKGKYTQQLKKVENLRNSRLLVKYINNQASPKEFDMYVRARNDIKSNDKELKDSARNILDKLIISCKKYDKSEREDVHNKSHKKPINMNIKHFHSQEKYQKTEANNGREL